MTNITIPAPAKINLSLRIVGKREDGYHLLESLVVFAKYGDEIEVQPAKELSLEIIGEFADALQNEPKEKNLVWRAAVALRRHCEEALADAAIQKSEENKGWIASCHATLAVRNAEVVRSGAKITLTKNLPIGSGIGGGSADAAATLKALCQLWKLDISPEELAEIGLKLGSDVPVCLYGKPAIMLGIGEIITPALRFYDTKDLQKVIERAATMLGIGISKDGSFEVARRSRGTPRIALRLLRRVRDFAHADDKDIIDAQLADSSLRRLEVDNLGLDSADHRYLKYIADHYQGGPVGVETIAAGLSEQRDAIEETIEPYLLQIGLIQRTPRGRMLTHNCFKHLGLKPPVAIASFPLLED